MKYLLAIILQAAFSFNLCYGQGTTSTDYSVRYAFTSAIDTNNLDLHRPIDFILLGADNNSFFGTTSGYLNDSLVADFEKRHGLTPELEEQMSDQEADRMDRIYDKESADWQPRISVYIKVMKDFTSRQAKVNLPLLTAPPNHMVVSVNHDWKILSDTATILGLVCQAAETYYGGRRYIAWFTPEIPLSDGPYVFAGLPGLIVKVSDDRGWYNFLMTAVTLRKQTRFWSDQLFSSYSQEISRKEYVRTCQRAKNNGQTSHILNASPERVLRSKNKNAKRFYLLLERAK